MSRVEQAINYGSKSSMLGLAAFDFDLDKQNDIVTLTGIHVKDVDGDIIIPEFVTKIDAESIYLKDMDLAYNDSVRLVFNTDLRHMARLDGLLRHQSLTAMVKFNRRIERAVYADKLFDSRELKTRINIENIDTSGCISMKYAYQYVSLVPDVLKIDITRAEHITGLMKGAKDIKQAEIIGGTHVINADNAFMSAIVKELSLGNLTVDSCSNMFYGSCIGKLDMSGFRIRSDTSKGSNLMFAHSRICHVVYPKDRYTYEIVKEQLNSKA